MMLLQRTLFRPIGRACRPTTSGSVVVAAAVVVRGFARSGGIETVPLAYDLHEPAKPVADRHTSPIIFMHGLFGSKKNNRAMSKALARDLGRHVYTLDLRNHGDSPHVPRHDYPAMAADVAAFMEEHKLVSPTLIGHSMGAKTAMTLALDAPDRIRDVVSVDNAPVDGALRTDFATYIRAMREIDRAGLARQADADAILARVEPSLPVRQFLLGNLHRPDRAAPSVLRCRLPLDVLAASLAHMGDFPYKDPDAARFEGPALFVRGTKSHYVADEALPLVGRFFPRFELADIDAGHWVISEKPEEFRQAVVRFLGPKE